MRYGRLFLSLVLGSLGLVAAGCVSTKKPLPATAKEVAGTWVGWADELHYYRLELLNDGTGLCGFTEVLGHPKTTLYRVSNWTLDKYSLNVALIPVGESTCPMTMRGTAHATALYLNVGDGRRHGWRGQPVLKRESYVEQVTQATKKRMEAHK